MIVLVRGRVVKQASGKPRVIDVRTYKKFPDNYDFGFDIMKPIEWKKFLSQTTFDGKKLARRTADGDEVVYKVAMVGLKKEFLEMIAEKGRNPYANVGGYYCLFPSYDLELSKQMGSNKELNMAIYGKLED